MPHTTFIDPYKLVQHLADPDWIVIDCRFDLERTSRGKELYEQAHIPGAQYAHLETDLSAPLTGKNGRHPLPSHERMVQLFSGLGIHSPSQVVVYDDRGGGFAARLWWMLRYMGHAAVAVLNGGFPAWQETGKPTTSGVETAKPKTFIPQVQPAMLIQQHQLVTEPATLLVDSRARERYLGEVEPIDPVAGRIPGAKNRFWQDNLDPQARIRPLAELRAELLALLQDTPALQTTFYCGSGVTACFNLLVMEYVGLPGSTLYAGSWSEWSANPANPVERGDPAA